MHLLYIDSFKASSVPFPHVPHSSPCRPPVVILLSQKSAFHAVPSRNFRHPERSTTLESAALTPLTPELHNSLGDCEALLLSYFFTSLLLNNSFNSFTPDFEKNVPHVFLSKSFRYPEHPQTLGSAVLTPLTPELPTPEKRTPDF